MAKSKRVTIGSVMKSQKDGKFYIKVNGEHKLSDGQYLNLESKEDRIQSLDKAVEEGKLSEEKAREIRVSIDKTPAFVKFNVISVQKIS